MSPFHRLRILRVPICLPTKLWPYRVSFPRWSEMVVGNRDLFHIKNRRNVESRFELFLSVSFIDLQAEALCFLPVGSSVRSSVTKLVSTVFLKRMSRLSTGQGREMVNFGARKSSRTRPKIDFEAWRRHHSRPFWVEYDPLGSSSFSSFILFYCITIRTINPFEWKFQTTYLRKWQL